MGCATTSERMVERPRMVWSPEEQTVEGHIQMGWAGGNNTESDIQAYWAGPKIAVLPVYNVIAAPAPKKELESLISDALKKNGVSVLEESTLNRFMEKHRMRYVGGLDSMTASAMKDETGVEAVLISTLEFFNSDDPPRISLHARLVSTGPDPEIQWIDSVCMAGDDAPGFLDLGLISDPRELMKITAERLARSLVLHLAGTEEVKDEKDVGKGIRPTVTYRSPILGTGEVPTVAVMPFLNLSERPYAWEILPLHFVKQMIDTTDFKILEPGVVRRALLKSRVTVQGGLSRPNLELVLIYTEADLVLTGTVMRYIDSNPRRAEPMVEFSAQVFDRGSKDVVWSSRSVGSGGDDVYFFGVGRRSTACGLTEDLTRAVVTEMTTGN